MNKAEIRTQAKETAIAQILPHLTDPVKIDDYIYAVRVGTAEDNGAPLYAKIDISVSNWYATKSSQAFDINAAVAKYAAKCEEREQNAAEREAKRTERT